MAASTKDLVCERCFLPLSVGAHGLYVCPFEPRGQDPRLVRTIGRVVRRDPEAVIAEVGAKKLAETSAGRAVLENARQKYRAELIQPHESGFREYWGRDVARRARDMRELKEESRRLKREAGME